MAADGPEHDSNRSWVIAIDGPGGAGKGTLLNALATVLGFATLDTGAIYRRLAYLCLKKNLDVENIEHVLPVARSLRKNFTVDMLGGSEIRGEHIGNAASKVAKLAAVRDILNRIQRDFAKHPKHPDGTDAPGAILDGRDIGTVICPDADIKLFLTGREATRAMRHYMGQLSKGAQNENLHRVFATITERDFREATRNEAPMRPADNALVINTTRLSADYVFYFTLIHAASQGLDRAKQALDEWERFAITVEPDYVITDKTSVRPGAMVPSQSFAGPQKTVFGI